MMGGYGPGYGMGSGLLAAGCFTLFGLLTLIGLILLVVWAIKASHGTRAATGGSPAPRTDDDAITIARRRFASGEISKDEYDQLVRTLSER